MTFTYILIDTTLIGDSTNKPWLKKRRKPSWVVSLYDREAIAVSPILIDVERAIRCNALDVVMGLVNAQHPQLGVSFIETDLTLAELHAHLRKFIFVKTAKDAELTLRFADCVVLPALAAVLADEQWSSIVALLKSWKIHDRNGKLKSLSIFTTEVVITPPLLLSDVQIASLEHAMMTDQLLANLRKMRPGRASDYSTQEAFEFADRARQMWISVGHEEDTELLLFIREVFDTDGRLLNHVALNKILAQPDPILRRQDLRRIANPH